MKYLRNYLSQKEEESELDTDTLGGDLALYAGGGTEYDQGTPQATSFPNHSETSERHRLDETSGNKKAGRPSDPSKLIQVVVKVLHNNRVARLMLDRRPPAKGFAWLKYEEDGNEFEATLRDVQLIAIEEGEW